MPWFTVTQPDGRFAIFSTIIDNFIIYNATKEQIIQFKVARAKEEIENEFDRRVDEYQKFDECIKDLVRQHGKKGIPKNIPLK